MPSSVLSDASADGSDDEASSMPDLTAPPLAAEPCSPSTRHLLALDDTWAALQHRLLKLAAGMHGAASLQVLDEELLPRLASFNREQQKSGRPPRGVAEAREPFFLERTVLHLLVSEPRVWGPGGDEHPPGLLDAHRRQLLDRLCGGDARSVRRLLRSTNRNQATPLFSAAHFSNRVALEWLLGRQELSFRTMLRPTKRGACLPLPLRPCRVCASLCH